MMNTSVEKTISSFRTRISSFVEKYFLLSIYNIYIVYMLYLFNISESSPDLLFVDDIFFIIYDEIKMCLTSLL